MSSDEKRNSEPNAAGEIEAIANWLRRFSAAVRAQDYDAGRPMFAPEVIGFGTYADALSGLDALIEGQWKNIWGVTRGFEYDVDEMRCEMRGDFAWVAVTWRSQKQDKAGVWRNRPGRATMILQKREGIWLAVHSHFSLSPSLARTDYLEMNLSSPAEVCNSIIAVTPGHSMTIYISHDNCYTVKRFLKIWAPALRPQVRLIYYADLAYRRTLPPEVSIFMDIERLSPAQIALADKAAARLCAADIPVLNIPSRVLRRYDLLRALHAAGINNFSCFRLGDDRSSMKFPVFLRVENEHQGSLSDLLQNEIDLEAAIAQAKQGGLQSEELLIVEFLDTADAAGIYRKYSAFMIGGELVTRHLLFSRNWLLKKPDIVATDKALEEQAYLELNPHPHEAQLRRVFEMAGIDYGRIDYAMIQDEVQVWEINTNPSIVPEAAIAPERESAQVLARNKIVAALQSLVTPERKTTNKIDFRPSGEVLQQLGASASERWLHPARRALRPLQSQRAQRLLGKFSISKRAAREN